MVPEKEDSKRQSGHLMVLYLRVLQFTVFLVAVLMVSLFYWEVDPNLGWHKEVEVSVQQPQQQEENASEEVKDGIHLATGLAFDDRFDIVRANCTVCHSAKLITQNRAEREGWHDMIKWMQQTQKLWDLGDNEAIILDYLTAHYAPEEQSRRKALTNIEWYELQQ